MKKQIVSGLLAASLLAASVSGTAFAATVDHPDLIFGDANVDGKINIKDATVMQMLLVFLI